jgi:ATP-dependent exoDNAse (exonuclease V) alpha subunit
VQRVQFPLRVAYACTFNGCVGLTLDKTVLDLRTPVFAHGQLYTALSRVRCRADTRLLFDLAGGPETENVVYKDLLL